MAIFFLDLKIVKRSAGQNVVAAAAYRSGEKLIDEKTGEKKFYRREVAPETFIMAPEIAPSWVYNRQKLWNEVERIEVRKDAQLAREVVISIPKELDNEQQMNLVREFVQNEFVSKGMICDISIHRDQKDQPHAHILLSMREITENGFGKKNREWNANFSNGAQGKGYVKDGSHCVGIREAWANIANKHLELAGRPERISHLSNEARGLDELPTQRMGWKAAVLEKKGVSTPVGELNKEIKQYNEEIKETKAQIIELKKAREEKKQQEQVQNKWKHFSPKEKTIIKQASQQLKGFVDLEKVEKRLVQLGNWEKKLQNQEKVLDVEQRKYEKASFLVKDLEDKQKEWDSLSLLKRLKSPLKNEINETKSSIEKQGFPSTERFKAEFEAFKERYNPEKTDIATQKDKIIEERSVMESAKDAFRKAKIREVAAQYPDWKGRNGLDYERAVTIDEYNQSQGKVVPIEEMKQLGNPSEESKGIPKPIPTNPLVEPSQATNKSYVSPREWQQNHKSSGGGQLASGIIDSVIHSIRQAEREAEIRAAITEREMERQKRSQKSQER